MPMHTIAFNQIKLAQIDQQPLLLQTMFDDLKHKLATQFDQYQAYRKLFVQLATLASIHQVEQIKSQWLNLIKQIDQYHSIQTANQFISHQLTQNAAFAQKLTLKSIPYLTPQYIQKHITEWALVPHTKTILKQHHLTLKQLHQMSSNETKTMIDQQRKDPELQDFLFHFGMLKHWISFVVNKISHIYYDDYHLNDNEMTSILNQHLNRLNR